MRRFVKWFSIFVGLLAIFVAYVALTESGEMGWLALDRKATLTEDGQRVEGWVHRDWKYGYFIVTRKGFAGRESYLVSPGGRRGPFVEGCDGWTAARLPVLPFPVFVSDALPCPGWRLPEHPTHHGPVTLSSTSMEFVNERGVRVQVSF